MINGLDVRDIVGSCHVGGGYSFTSEDHMNEGADQLLELGSRVIKVWFTPRPAQYYPIHSNWPPIASMIDLASCDYFKKLFAKPFTTFLLEAFRPGIPDEYYVDGVSAENAEAERAAFYEITQYLLTTYKGTGKTFILQNWESDWVLTNPEFTKEPSPVAIQGMIDWMNARQDGVDAARKDVGMDGVTVAHAMEVNLIARAMEGKVTATNDVVPHTHCDLYSYSAYDTSIFIPDKFRDALQYLADKAPASELYGEKNVYVGEFGAPENEFDQYAIVKRTVETALDWGARYMLYWQVYCGPGATNSDCRGFWLIRPDGTKSPAYQYYSELFGS